MEKILLGHFKLIRDESTSFWNSFRNFIFHIECDMTKLIVFMDCQKNGIRSGKKCMGSVSAKVSRLRADFKIPYRVTKKHANCLFFREIIQPNLPKFA